MRLLNYGGMNPAIDWIFVDGAEHFADRFADTAHGFSMGYFFLPHLSENCGIGQPGFLCSCGISFPLRVQVSRIVAIVPYTSLWKLTSQPLKKVMGRNWKTRRRSDRLPFWNGSPLKNWQLKMWNLRNWWVDWLVEKWWCFFPPAFKSPMVFNWQNPGGVTVTNRLPGGWIVTIFFQGAWMPLLLWFDAERWRVFDHLGVGSEP